MASLGEKFDASVFDPMVLIVRAGVAHEAHQIIGVGAGYGENFAVPIHPRSKTGRAPRCGAEIHPPGIAVLAGNEHVEKGQSLDHGYEGYHQRRVAKRLCRGQSVSTSTGQRGRTVDRVMPARAPRPLGTPRQRQVPLHSRRRSRSQGPSRFSVTNESRPKRSSVNVAASMKPFRS